MIVKKKCEVKIPAQPSVMLKDSIHSCGGCREMTRTDSDHSTGTLWNKQPWSEVFLAQTLVWLVQPGLFTGPHSTVEPDWTHYELQSSLTLSRSLWPSVGGWWGVAVWFWCARAQTHTHLERSIFGWQVKGLKSVTEGDLTRKPVRRRRRRRERMNEYAEGWRGVGWQSEGTSGVWGGGHEVMRGLNATNAMSPGLIQTSSALLQGQRSHTVLHLCCRDPASARPT